MRTGKAKDGEAANKVWVYNLPCYDTMQLNAAKEGRMFCAYHQVGISRLLLEKNFKS